MKELQQKTLLPLSYSHYGVSGETQEVLFCRKVVLIQVKKGGFEALGGSPGWGVEYGQEDWPSGFSSIYCMHDPT